MNVVMMMVVVMTLPRGIISCRGFKQATKKNDDFSFL